MYKASKLVEIIDRDGNVSYGKPRHTPMTGWGDYDLVPTEEVEQDEDPVVVAARRERNMKSIAEQLELEREWKAKRIAEGLGAERRGKVKVGAGAFGAAQAAADKAGSTIHEAGCPCGFCKAGFTKA